MSPPAMDDIARQLQLSEARFRRIFEDSPISLQLTARDGRTLRVNRAWLELWGVPEQVLEPYVYATYNIFEDPVLQANGTTELVRRAFAGETFALPPTHYDPAETGRPGRARWVQAYIYPIKSAEGVIDEVVLMYDDITERKRTEEALRANEARLASIHAVVTDVIFLLAVEGDDAYRFESINQAFSVTTGLPAGAVLGRRVEEVIPEPSLTLVRDRYREAITRHKPVRWQETTSYPTGQLVGEVTVTPLFAPDGHATHLVGAVHDITDKKRAEEVFRNANEYLREADRRKNEFLAVLSHELRNPLTPIRNSLFILSRAAPGGEQAQRAQAVIERQVGHMARLIEDLLDVTRITRGKVQLQLELLDLNELALSTVEDHRGAFVAGEIELQVKGAASQVWVKGDRTRLAQVISNLLQNAAKFTGRGGKTTVSVQADATGGAAIVRVQDTGKGIPPEMLPRLFEPFAQADITLDRRKGGLGLGLALVKGLVEMHGGTVNGTSGGPGTGATFTISLPLATTLAAETGQASAEVRARARRVLVIEDNVDAAQSLREALALEGHEVEVAYTGPEGIERARSFGPEVVLCDIGLPEMDGYQVARGMRADPELGRVTLVALTGYARPEDVAKAKEAGFNAHLAKPPSMDAIERALGILR